MLRKIFIALLFLSMNAFSQTPLIEPGVSQTLARWRAAHYSDVRYKLNLTLEKGAPLMKGTIEIRVNLSETGAKNDLVLDWRTTQFQNDKDKPFANVTGVNGATEILASTANEHITIPKALLKTGENVIKINFTSPVKTSGAAVTRYVDKEDGAEYVYSLFVPSDASTAFPVFDQPDLKARFSLELLVPLRWRTVSNTKTTSVIQVRDLTRFRFAETKPISTYVFAFATGDFTEFAKSATVTGNLQILDESSKDNELVSSIYVRKSQAEKFKQHAAETFRLNREAVKYLESYFDYKFPFPKYDLVLIPEFPFGGMEHAGATFLREDRVIFPTEPTKNDFVTRANLIFHEAAHQWFGDTVTMRLTMQNPSNAPLQTLQISNSLPSGLSYAGGLSASRGTASESNGTITWQGTVTAGTPVTLSYQARIDAGLTGATILRNSAQISGGQTLTLQALVIVNGQVIWLPSVGR